ncbi:MAG: transposase [Saprospiraceae bacterium]
MSSDKAEKVPHQDLSLVPVHIVYRLKDSLPASIIKKISLDRERDMERMEIKLRSTSTDRKNNARKEWVEMIEDKYEQRIENAIHQRKCGPFYLSQEPIRKIVFDSWKWLETHRKIRIYAICIMSNHVHILLSTTTAARMDTGQLMKAHKSFTALNANKILGRTGSPFWEVGYFDRNVRRGRFDRVFQYILDNPVKAGLVKKWEEWPGTYVNFECERIEFPLSWAA